MSYTDEDGVLMLALCAQLKEAGWYPPLLAVAREWSAASTHGYRFVPLGRRRTYDRGLYLPTEPYDAGIAR